MHRAAAPRQAAIAGVSRDPIEDVLGFLAILNSIRLRKAKSVPATLRHLSLFLLLLSFGQAQAAGFADLPSAWKDVALLNNRIDARIPDAAQLVPPNGNIMEAPAPPERELRIILDAGPLRMVAVVTELFRLAATDFEGVGKSYAKSLERRFRFDELAVSHMTKTGGGLQVLTYIPHGKANVPGATMIKGLLVRQSDGSLQLMSFFLNEPGMANVPAANHLVDQIIKSLKPGTRRLLTGARSGLADNRLTLDLPTGYPAYAQPGPDFSVYWVEHLVPLEDAAGRLGFYRGQYPQAPAAPVTARTLRAPAFGTDMEWREWEQPGEGGSPRTLHAETFLQAPGSAHETLHIFAYAVSDAELTTFLQIAATATLN